MERSEAIKLCLHKYNTGRPCRNGHMADRYTYNGSCTGCIRASTRDIYKSKTDQLDIKTELIIINIHKNDMLIVKAILDNLVIEHCPEFPPDSVNPFPFRKAIVEDDGRIFITPVRVPRDKVDQVRALTKTMQMLSAGRLQDPNYAAGATPIRENPEMDENNP